VQRHAGPAGRSRVSVLARVRLRAARLRLAVLVVALSAASAHLAITLARDQELDLAIVAVDGGLAVLLLAATYAHLRALTRERQRHAFAMTLIDLTLQPRHVHDAAGRALMLIIESGLAETGLIAIAETGAPEMEPIAASGYPEGWVDTAPALPLPARDADPSLARHRREPHPWVDPLLVPLGARPWIATVPLVSHDEPIGLVLLAARRPGAMADRAMLRLVQAPLVAALHHGELFEATYQRERDLEDQATRHREFLAAMAHEVRTPLSSIRAFVDLLTIDGVAVAGAPGGPRSELVGSLTRGVERLSQLINDLLDVGEVHDSALRVTPALIDVGETLRLAETVLRPAFMLREQSLSLELPETPMYAVADRRHLEQVMLNLLSNANRHTPKCGRIAVRAGPGESGYARIEVEDSGPGIEPTDRRRIFEPYYRVQRPGARSVPGSGLGLAVARRLTQLQGGRIWVEDAPDGGARFCVELRAAAPPRAVQSR